MSVIDRVERRFRDEEPSRPSGATPARTRLPGDTASSRAQGAGPVHPPGHDEAHAAQAALSPISGRVPPATSRAKFTLREIQILQRYALWGYFHGGAPKRAEFLGIVPDAAPLGKRLDVIDVALGEIGRLMREDAREARRRAAKRRQGGAR